MAKLVLDAYGGSDGEFSASTTYLTQRYSMPLSENIGMLTDIGTEELAHRRYQYKKRPLIGPTYIKKPSFS